MFRDGLPLTKSAPQVDNEFTARFLQFIFSHQTLLSSPSDLLVVCMTFSRFLHMFYCSITKIMAHGYHNNLNMSFSRLRILWHADSRQVFFACFWSFHISQGRNTEPRPIVLQILFAYGFSAMMDLPNFFKYEIKDCSNKTSEDAPLEKDCWSFVEVMSWK